MKREFLKNLGIEDKDVIDKIMDENSADIGNAKGKATSDIEKLQTQVTDLQTQLEDRDTQLEALKGVDVEKLNGEIERLQAENKSVKEESDKKLAEITKTTGIKEKLMKAQAKNPEKVMKLLDMESIELNKDGILTGIDEQLDALLKDDLTKSWFGNTPAMPKGAEPTPGAGNPAQKKISEMSYSELDSFMKEHPDVDISTME